MAYTETTGVESHVQQSTTTSSPKLLIKSKARPKKTNMFKFKHG